MRCVETRNRRRSPSIDSQQHASFVAGANVLGQGRAWVRRAHASPRLPHAFVFRTKGRIVCAVPHARSMIAEAARRQVRVAAVAVRRPVVDSIGLLGGIVRDGVGRDVDPDDISGAVLISCGRCIAILGGRLATSTRDEEQYDQASSEGDGVDSHTAIVGTPRRRGQRQKVNRVSPLNSASRRRA